MLAPRRKAAKKNKKDNLINFSLCAFASWRDIILFSFADD
jgi:hypothetical protein